MASSLPTLIKLAKHRVDNVQKQLAATQAAIDALDADLAALEAEVLRGGEVAAEANDPAVFAQAAAYVKRAKKAKEQMLAQRAQLEAIQAQQRTWLQEHYAEQKRYETLHQRQEMAAKKAREAKQQKALDEAAAVVWQGQ